MTTKKKANPIKFLEGLASPKKMPIILTEDKLHDMLFDVEWDLAEKTQNLIKVLKAQPEQDYEKAMSIVDKLENLLDKRMNVLSAQMLLDDMEKQK